MSLSSQVDSHVPTEFRWQEPVVALICSRYTTIIRGEYREGNALEDRGRIKLQGAKGRCRRISFGVTDSLSICFGQKEIGLMPFEPK